MDKHTSLKYTKQSQRHELKGYTLSPRKGLKRLHIKSKRSVTPFQHIIHILKYLLQKYFLFLKRYPNCHFGEEGKMEGKTIWFSLCNFLRGLIFGLTMSEKRWVPAMLCLRHWGTQQWTEMTKSLPSWADVLVQRHTYMKEWVNVRLFGIATPSVVHRSLPI